MRRERDAPMHLFDLVPALGMTMDPVLRPLDTLLDDDTRLQAVPAELARRRPRTRMDGRPSTPVEVLRRMLVVKHLAGWRDEATARGVRDSRGWRPCCRVYAAPVPEDTTLRRGAHLLQPATLPRRLDPVVVLARALNVTRGRQRRLDGTVAEPNSQHPTDSTWLDDAGRVLRRRLGTAKAVRRHGAALTRQAGRERTRRATRQMQQLTAAARRRGAAAADRRHAADQPLLAITPVPVQQAPRVGAVLRAQATQASQKLRGTWDDGIPLVPQGRGPTTRRVFQGAAVPAPENLGRWCEPHTAIIRPGTPGKATACGRVLGLAEVEGGILSRYAVLDGHPAEDAQRPPRLDHHVRLFTRPPRLLAGERGVHTTAPEP